MNKIYTVKYKIDGREVISHDKENDIYSLDIQQKDNRYTVTLNPKKNFELIEFYAEFPFKFKSGDKFFGSGYQSWTKTREYTADEIMRGVIKLSNICEYTKGIATKGVFIDLWISFYLARK